MKTAILSLTAAALMAAPALAHAQHGDHAANAAAPAAAPVEGVGVVRKIDAKAMSVTLNHEPIKAMNWPAMTMPFKVADKAVLDELKVGAKVRFTLSGQTITAVRPF